MYNNSDENYSSIQPKNVTYVLWRHINTAEQFKTGVVTDKKIAIGNLSIAPLEALPRRSLWLQQAGGRFSNGIPSSVPSSPQAGSTRNTPSVLKAHWHWPDETCAWNKNYIWWRCLANVLSSPQNRIKQSQKTAEGMKIYNSQLVMSLVYRSTLELLQSTLQVYITTMAWYREIHTLAPSRLASCVICCKKRQQGLLTSLLSGQSPGETK